MKKNSSLKPTKTTWKFYFPIPFIIHIIAFFIPKRNPAHPLPKPSTPSSSLLILIMTLHLKRRQRFTSWSRRFRHWQRFSSLPIATIQTPATLLLWPATLQFQSRCFNSRSPATLHPSQHPITTLQLSIAGGTSSFTTSNDTSVRDASWFFFFFFPFWVNFFVNFCF